MPIYPPTGTGALNRNNYGNNYYGYDPNVYVTAAQTTFYNQITASQTQAYWTLGNYAYNSQPIQYQPLQPYYAYSAGMGSQVQITAFPPLQPLTPKQRREQRRQARLDDLASKRAKALLLEHLTDDQRAEYEEHEYFHVLSQGGRLYRIKRGSAGNVYRIGNDGSVEAKFCIHARDPMPHEDNMLMQTLMLRFDEEQFLATANRHW